MAELPLVVVADDNADIRHLVDRRLSKRGYRVVTAADGEEALTRVRELGPQAVVLDWMMPVVQGPDVVSRLRADPATAGLPIVMLTARAAEADVATGFECGADDYLTKPFDVAELDQVIRRLLAARS